MGLKSSKPHYEPKRIYWDGDGNLRHGVTERNRDAEILRLLQSDSADDSDPNKLWIIIPSRWIREWLLFVYHKIGSEPGPIDMFTLIVRDNNAPGGFRPKKTLQPPSENKPGHYRRISLESWIALYELYGCKGYPLAVRGTPFDDKERWRVFKDPRRIDINLLPEPIITPEEKKKEGIKENLKSLIDISSFNIFKK